MNLPDLAIEYLIRSSFVLVMTCLAIWLTGKFSIPAALRHRLGMIGTFIVLIMPVFLALELQWGVIPSPFDRSIKIELPDQRPTSKLSSNSEAEPTSLLIPADLIPEKTDLSFPQWMFILWLCGGIILSLFALSALFFLHRIKLKTDRVSPRVIGILTRLLDSNRIQRNVSLAVSSHVNLPFTWGVFLPVIALPTEMEEWSDDRLRLVLTHELAHISRFDAVSLLLGRILIALHWFNPFAWILNRQLEGLREEACDSLVLRKGTPPSDYAELLYQMATGPRSIAVFTAAVSEPQTLQSRIKMILNNSKPLTKPSRGIFTILSLLAITVMTIPFATLSFADNDQKAKIQEQKLKEIIVPKIEFHDTPFLAGMNFLVQRSKELDTISKDPKKRGVNIACIGDFENSLVTVDLKNIPLGEALKLITLLVDGKIEKRSNVIVIRAKDNSHSVAATVNADERSETNRKLDEINIPQLEFNNTKITDAMAFIRQRSVELDTKAPVDKKGLNLALNLGDKEVPTITLKLTDQTLRDVLLLVAESAGLKMKVENDFVLLTR